MNPFVIIVNMKLLTLILNPGPANGHFPSGLPTKILYEFIFPMRATYPANIMLP